MSETMKPKSALDLLRRRGDPGTPEVSDIDPEVRSGVTFLLRDPRRRGVSAEELEAVGDSLDKKVLIDALLIEWSYDVPHDKTVAFRRWLLDNERDLARLCPAHVSYRGTYAVASGSLVQVGRYRTLWGLAELSGLSNLSAGVADEKGAFSRLVSELNAFRDRERGAPEFDAIMVPAVSAHRF
ncbi:MAG: hypothetical protein Kilf2KO_38610 [Rhodospirillales bacterium]